MFGGYPWLCTRDDFRGLVEIIDLFLILE